MENIVLTIHLLLALALIAVVLLQRSEGGGLSMGGGGGVVSGRAAASALARVTWGLAAAFIGTSIAMTIIAAEKSAGASVLDRLRDAPAPVTAPLTPVVPGGDLLPPTDSGPLVPKAD